MTMMIRFLRSLARSRAGSSAAEFALWTAGIGFPVVSVVDLAGFAHQRMQTEQAAEAAIFAAWQACDRLPELPAVKNCANLTSLMTTAAQSTSLGTTVTLATANPVEGYYCISSGALTLNGTTATIGATPVKATATCPGTLSAPGDYLKVTVNRTYAPLFTRASVGAALPTTITAVAWVRLN